MAGFQVIEVKESIFAENDRQADALRQKLKAEKTFLLNLMSSPGAGKTTIPSHHPTKSRREGQTRRRSRRIWDNSMQARQSRA